jgi:hypothetical protein
MFLLENVKQSLDSRANLAFGVIRAQTATLCCNGIPQCSEGRTALTPHLQYAGKYSDYLPS